ncbi:MAG: phosphate/phosphite/phosphonate ABC transporter substrate-binding protein [Elainellaceae cyanobacterium]
MTKLLHLRPKSLALIVSLGLIISPTISACVSSQTSELSNFSDPAAVEDVVQIGVLVLDNVDATRARYEPLFDELSSAIGRPVNFVPMPFESILLMAEAGKVDFVISSPLSAVQMRRLNGTEFLATIALEETGAKYGGLIVVKPDSPITTANDLVGRTGACASMTTSAAGCLFQIYHLNQKGLDPRKPSNDIRITEIPSHDKIVDAVLNDDEIEFGFVRSDQLQRMVDRGLLSSIDEVRVLEPTQDDYPLAHTTQLYPTWPIAAFPDTPEVLREQVRQALLNIPEGHESLASAGFSQIIPPADYSEVDNLIETLNLTSAEAE